MSKMVILDESFLPNHKVKLQYVKENVGGCVHMHHRLVWQSLTDKELLERYHQVKPLGIWDGIYFYLKKYNVKMMRNNDLIGDVLADIRKVADMWGSKELGKFECYIPFTIPEMLQPTLATVLEQFPDELLEEANAFVVADYPKNFEDIIKRKELLLTGYHPIKVKAYKLR